jgi:TolA-binding protein
MAGKQRSGKARTLATAWIWLVLLWAAPVLISQVDPFYLKALADGEKAYAAGDFPAAVQRFEIAAFGLHGDKNALIKAWGYLCVAAYKAGQIEESREVAQKFEEAAGTTDMDSVGLKPEVAADLMKLIKFFKENLQSQGTSVGEKTRVLPSSQASQEGSGTTEGKIAADREKSLNDALKADPKNATLYLDLYDFYLIQKKPEKARNILKRLVKKVPEEPRGPYHLAKIYYSERNFKAAAKYFEKVLVLTLKKPGESSLPLASRGHLILCQNALGRKKDVARQCAEFLGVVPDGDTSALDMAERDKAQLKAILAQNRVSPTEGKKKPPTDAAAARAAIPQPQPESAALREPSRGGSSAQPPKELALAYGVYDQYLQNDHLSAARRTLQSILRKYPQERRARFLLAKMDYQDEKYKDAQEGFRAVLEAGPAGSGDALPAEAAAYLILGVEKWQGLEAARTMASTYRDLLSGPVLDSLSLDGSDKQKVRDLVESRSDSPSPVRTLSDIQVKKSEDSLRIEIIYSPPGGYRTFVLRNERKIILDLFNVTHVRSARIIPVNSLGLQSIRTGMFEENTARIVLDANGEIPPYNIQQTAAGLVIIISQGPLLAAEP